MPYAYVTVTTLTSTGALSIDGTAFDARLRQVAEAVTRQIDRYANRTFQTYEATRTFPGLATTLLMVPDLVKVTTLKEDTNYDGTFETTWESTDYILEPENANPTSTAENGLPYTRLRVNAASNGTQDLFLAGAKRYQVIGTWGYWEVTRDISVDTSGSLGSTATTINVNTSGIEPGMTVLIDSEMIYVESTGAAGTALTVRRNQNGSTAGTHATTKDVNHYVYPYDIREAAFIQAARLWKRKDSGFASQVGFAEIGQMSVWSGGLDPDVKQMLNPYRKMAFAI